MDSVIGPTSRPARVSRQTKVDPTSNFWESSCACGVVPNITSAHCIAIGHNPTFLSRHRNTTGLALWIAESKSSFFLILK
jgi:hypothetical protein